jgi:tRNA pseudouridine55 synthase
MLSMDGVLIIDKPAGMTSHDVVARVRKMIGERRIGHTGTLDPFATGVLVLLVGRATRIAQFLTHAEKEYEGIIRLGYATDTGDFTGERVEPSFHAQAQSPQSLRNREVTAAMSSLRGEIEQLPPMYSAKKIAGRKLYELARRGEEVARQPAQVTIHEFELITPEKQLCANGDTLDIRVRVVCSAGTYIRTLAEDLGRKLGMGAHLLELRRTRAGQFHLDAALTLEKLDEALSHDRLAGIVISPHDALPHLASINLDDKQLQRTMHGLNLPMNDNDQTLSDEDPVRLSRNNQLIAVGKYNAEQRTIHPEVVFGLR